MDPKQRAGEAALQFIRDGMIVGLGTGSTAKFFIEALAGALRDKKLRNVRGVPTSVASENLARQSGLPTIGFGQVEKVDVTVDGADEIAPDLSLIKGLGGALLREKLVAQNSDRLIIIADSSKLVSKLGSRTALPVEVTQFGFEASERFLRRLGAIPTLRKGADGKPFITDNSNYIFDCKFDPIEDPGLLDARLSGRAGIVESGLFLGLADTALVADADGVRTMKATLKYSA
jgi:ribose 5-phosphate isomerase A